MKAPHALPDPSGGFLGTRRRPPVTATRVPAPDPPQPPAPPAPVKAPSGRFPARAAPTPAPDPPPARKAPSRGSAGQVGQGPVVAAPQVIPVGSPDALLRRYADALGCAPPRADDLRALLHGLLTEHAEVIAQRLEAAAFVNAAEPLHRDAAIPLSHAAMVVRAEFGVRPMR